MQTMVVATARGIPAKNGVKPRPYVAAVVSDGLRPPAAGQALRLGLVSAER